MKILKFQAALLILHVCAIGLFTCGFLLTRVELHDRSTCEDFKTEHLYDTCLKPPFSKVVLVIVDALRFDFFHTEGEQQLIHQNQLPRLKRLLATMGPSAMSAKFVADPPTTTMQRLKAMLTGALPTFVDVGNSFSASAVTEDNLAHQLQRQGRRIVFVGDDTWTQLVPEVFTQAYPYPSFNVKDLHTVDNGVWEHVVPLLKSPDDWDVLIAHYLGVDHAGHTHGVNSPQMRDKVQQMDEQLTNITEYLLSQAGSGGAHENTLLVMLSDHGQTMGGDHGGGSDEEVDSFFAAFNLSKARQWLQAQGKLDPAIQPAAESVEGVDETPDKERGVDETSEKDVDLVVDGSCTANMNETCGGTVDPQEQERDMNGIGDGSDVDKVSETGSDTAVPQLDTDVVGDGSCREKASETCSSTAVPQLDAGVTGDGCSAAEGNGACWSTVVSQLDFTATLAVLLGTPIPYGNLGKVSPHVWRVVLQDGRLPTDCQAPIFSGWQPSDLVMYVHILMTNAAQVQRYLQAYSKTASLPSAALSHCTRLYEDAAAAFAASASGEPEAAAGKLLDYLAAAADVARHQFTQFNLWMMGAGCGVMALAVVLQLVKTWQSFGGFGPWCWSLNTLVALVCIGFHAGAIFSTNLIMSEGRVQCALVVTLSFLLLLRSCLAASWKLRTNSQADAVPQVPPHTAGSDAIGQLPPSQNQNLGRNGSLANSASGRGSSGRRSVRGGVANVREGVTSVRRGVTSAVCAGLLVAASVALWMYGLIDRTGQDPHDKSEVDADDLQGPKLAWQQQVLQIHVPLLLFPLLFHVASKAISKHAGYIVHHAPMMVWSMYITIAMWWAARPYPDVWQSSSQDLMLKYIEQWQQQTPNTTSRTTLLQQLMQYTDTWLRAPHPVPDPSSGLWFPVQLLEYYTADHLQMPIRLLLPILVYAMCLKWLVGGLVLWLFSLLVRGTTGQAVRKSGGSEDDGKPAVQAVHRVAASAVVATAAVISGPVTILLGVKGPLVVLLAAVQTACIMAWVHTREAASCTSGCSTDEKEPSLGPIRADAMTDVGGTSVQASRPVASSDATQQGVSSQGGERRELSTAGEQNDTLGTSGVKNSVDSTIQGSGAKAASGAGGSDFLVSTLAAMHGVQLFFCSGHFCEFSGLQYPSSFVGFDDMQWYRSGLLLLMNTFGLHFLAYLLLPALAALMLPRSPSTSAAHGTGQLKTVPPPSQNAQESVTHESYTPSSRSRTEADHTAVASKEKDVHRPHSRAVPDAHGRLQQHASTAAVESTDGTGTATGAHGSHGTAAAKAVQVVVEDVQWGQYSQCLERVVLVAGLVRGLNALAAVISAGYQRRHLLVWALFAPKFVFEIWFLVMSHVATLVGLAIVACTR